MSNDVLQQELDSCLTEVEQVEKEIDQQLQVLAEKVDQGFMQMRELSSNAIAVANEVVSNPKFAKGVLYAAAAISAVTGAFENVSAAKAHNKALDELMITKKQIAKAKIDSIGRLNEIVDHVLGRLEKLVDNEAAATYDLSKIDGNVWKLKLSNMDKTMSLYRATLYSKLLVDYIGAEYKAWLNGHQRSRLDRPTYLDCNKLINERLSERKNVEAEINNLFQSEGSSVTGTEVYKASDKHLFSAMLLYYGLIEDNQIKPLPKLGQSPIAGMIAENNLYQSYKKSASNMAIANIFTGGMIGFLVTVAFFFLEWLLFHWLDWAGWLEWILGIILGIIGLIIIFSNSGNFRQIHENWVSNIYNEELERQLDAAGYVEIYEPDLEKKNLVMEGVKGTLGGLISTFFG